MVQTVQQIIEIPQLQFVARWSMSPLGTLKCRKTSEIPQLQFTKVVDVPVVTQRLIPMVQTVQQIIEIPQLQFVARWSMSPLRTLKCRKTSEIPQLQFTKVVDIPVVTQRLIPMVLVTVEIPSCSWTRGQCSFHAGRSHARCVQRQAVDIPVVTQRLFPMLQFYFAGPW